jgi:allophanate hydrolase
MALPYSLDIVTLSEAYARGVLTPAQVVGDICAAIAASGTPAPVWIHVVPRESLLLQAVLLERRRASGEELPLYGIPFAVKDNIDVAGCPTTAACPAYAYMPAASATVVSRLQQAGALMIGKTNLDQFATGLVGTRSPYGACINPFDARYIAGGSSSGSAVAVATGCVSFALGTDTAGSGRVPSAFNNIVGLKPSHGLLSTTGVVPACRSLDCVSIFALTCKDARTVFEAAWGYDEADIYSRRTQPLPLQAPRHFRCGVPRADQLEFFGDHAAQAAFQATLEALVAAGAQLTEIDYAPFAAAAKLLYEGPWIAERYAAIRDYLDAHPGNIHPVTHQIITTARNFSAVDAFEAQYHLQALKQRCAEEWQNMDVLVVPTTGTIHTLQAVAAAPVARNTELGYYTNFVNLLDLVALAVPGCFRADGLPAGLTLIAPVLHDRLLCELGIRVQRAAGVKLGATPHDLPPADDSAKPPAVDSVLLAVVGAHLSGMALNHQLTSRGARLVRTATTATAYRLYALPGSGPARPGLVRSANGNGAAIAVEVWSLPREGFGDFVAEIPPPLGIGTVTLDDGCEVKGFVCEHYAVRYADDISSYGGWRNYLANRAATPGSQEECP